VSEAAPAAFVSPAYRNARFDRSILPISKNGPGMPILTVLPSRQLPIRKTNGSCFQAETENRQKEETRRIMETKKHTRQGRLASPSLLIVLGGVLVLTTILVRTSEAGFLQFWLWRQGCSNHGCGDAGHEVEGLQLTGEPGGTWYWLRSPEEEKRVVMGLYSRYCIRCHGVDGRGIWDIPDVPNFTNAVWQASRSDGQLARAILEGRGAVMPPFRGTLTLEEAGAMARYLRTFIPGTEMPKPDLGTPEKVAPPKGAAPKN
jgi:cbb3-type cytochrome c oxidase subunit III